MYKVKRYSMMSESDFNSLLDSASLEIGYRFKMNQNALPKLAKDNLFGFGSGSSKGDLGIYHPTVRSGYRLRSYIKKFEPEKFIKAINDCKFTLNNGLEVLGKNYVEFRDPNTQETCNFIVLNNENDNPIIVGVFHESWDQLLDIALHAIDYTPDFYFYKKKLDTGEVMSRLMMTLDDYDMIVAFLAYFGYLRKVYGGVAGKVGLYIYKED